MSEDHVPFVAVVPCPPGWRALQVGPDGHWFPEQMLGIAVREDGRLTELLMTAYGAVSAAEDKEDRPLIFLGPDQEVTPEIEAMVPEYVAARERREKKARALMESEAEISAGGKRQPQRRM